MKGTMGWKLGYAVCALTGCLAGYGIFTVSGTAEIKHNNNTKDNTLVLESGDSVFFDAEKEEQENWKNPTEIADTMPLGKDEQETELQTPVAEKEETPIPEITDMPQKDLELQEIPVPTASADVRDKLNPKTSGEAVLPDREEELPSIASLWEKTAPSLPTQAPDYVPEGRKNEEEPPVEETLTYPAKIFGQTPVINRSDDYVSYFEFAYDLIAMLEPEVTSRGQNMNILLTKFVVKALLCGVDIEKLDINAPIPRRLAALCLWLAAQVLNEAGCDTSSKSAQQYVKDISNCSSSEKKAIAYLYEQGIIKGYQNAGQQFYPDRGLKTGQDTEWLSGVKRCWN